MARITIAPHDAFGLIDVQPTFMPGGGLAVADGDAVIAPVNRLIGRFETVFATQDWHPAGHSSFASAHPGKAPFETIEMPYGPQTLWPDHGIQGTAEAAIHPAIAHNAIDLILRKGTNPAIDSYSAFRENDRTTSTGLDGWLKARGVRRVFLAGLATDFCVAFSGIDAAKAGFETYIIEDACRAIAAPLGDDRTTLTEARAALAAAGVTLIQEADLA